MKKANVITALALTVVMLAALTGIAVAAQLSVAPEEVKLNPGNYVQTIVSLTGLDPGVGRTLEVSVDAGTPIDLTFCIDSVTITKGSIIHTYTPTVDTHTITVEIMAAHGTEGNSYEVYYYDKKNNAGDRCSATVPMASIPEFATIAMPVAAILGLVLFFNHRKRKKE